MGAPGVSAKKSWILAGAAGLGLLVLVVMLFRAPAGPPAAPGAALPPPAVGVASAGLLSEEAALFDRTPLFLPTQWNSTEKELPRREPGGFAAYEDKLTFAENRLELNLPPPIAVPSRLPEALAANPPQDRFLGIGRTDYQPPVLAARGAYLDVAAAGTGRRVLVGALADAHPPGDGTWEPLEFMIAVDPAGLVGPPVLTAGSGSEGVDAYFRNYLAETLRIGDRLEPGFYRICLGP
jgi:hypothetical protein